LFCAVYCLIVIVYLLFIIYLLFILLSVCPWQVFPD